MKHIRHQSQSISKIRSSQSRGQESIIHEPSAQEQVLNKLNLELEIEAQSIYHGDKTPADLRSQS